MKKLFTTTAIGLLALGVTSLGVPMGATVYAQEALPEAPAPAPEMPNDAAETVEAVEIKTVDADPALWVVKDEDTTIYLFGTFHILRPGLTWFDEAVKTAFDESDELVVEIIDPDGPAAQQAVMALAVEPSGTTLRSRLTEEDRTDYETTMQNLGLPAGAFDQFEPWFAAISLGALPLIKEGYDLNSGAEKTLLAAAKQSNKKLGELETVEFQLGIFDSLSMESQIKYLNETVDGAGEATAQIDTMVDQWAAGDPQKLGEMMNDGFTDGRLRDELLVRRNAAWSVWIDERLKQPGTVFIAVGAGHLAGEGSVQDQLKLRGIETVRIDY